MFPVSVPTRQWIHVLKPGRYLELPAGCLIIWHLLSKVPLHFIRVFVRSRSETDWVYSELSFSFTDERAWVTDDKEGLTLTDLKSWFYHNCNVWRSFKTLLNNNSCTFTNHFPWLIKRLGEILLYAFYNHISNIILKHIPQFLPSSDDVIRLIVTSLQKQCSVVLLFVHSPGHGYVRHVSTVKNRKCSIRTDKICYIIGVTCSSESQEQQLTATGVLISEHHYDGYSFLSFSTYL